MWWKPGALALAAAGVLALLFAPIVEVGETVESPSSEGVRPVSPEVFSALTSAGVGVVAVAWRVVFAIIVFSDRS